jgi:PhzF family phenazine biosynthesis protein
VGVLRVHAFSTNGAGGNLAGVVLDADGLEDAEMQTIATDVGASETAFVLPSKNETYRLRFFTPTTEVSMCGHATVAAWYAMTNSGLIAPGHYTQETSSGTVAIEVTDAQQVFMAMGSFNDLGNVSPSAISDCLGVPVEALDPTFAPEIVSSDLIIKLASPSALHSISPHFPKMIELSTNKNFYAFHVFCDSELNDVIADVRSFAPRVGITEDAATGTGNSDLLYLLSKRDLLPTQTTPYVISQGQLMGHPSRILGRVNQNVIWVGGEATLL